MGDTLRRASGRGTATFAGAARAVNNSKCAGARRAYRRAHGRRRRLSSAAPRACPAEPRRAPPLGGMSYKPSLTAHMPAASLNAAGSVHPPSTSMATSSQYCRLLSDYGPPPLGYAQGTGNIQVPQSKYASCWPLSKSWGKRSDPPTRGARARWRN
ncbi:hypothetical protein HPG69_007243 [Diceros bicornis minor]|uniref:Uncharacterized protein n=1 Tax=Diceros bicornis minor TaxID=77932 RepID=A0A7J7FN31_DICBM|nr:hypothetical protein HPG69_007243 [Diceros bicornis minor]